MALNSSNTIRHEIKLNAAEHEYHLNKGYCSDVDVDALGKYAPQQFPKQADSFFGNQVLVVRGREPCKSFLGVPTQDPIEVRVKLKIVFVKILKQVVST